MRDDAAVCANCGKTPDGTPARLPSAGLQKASRKTKKSSKTSLQFVAAILVFAIAVGVTTSFVGYRGCSQKSHERYKKADGGRAGRYELLFL